MTRLVLAEELKHQRQNGNNMSLSFVFANATPRLTVKRRDALFVVNVVMRCLLLMSWRTRHSNLHMAGPTVAPAGPFKK
jgi:hypothetical protein